MSKEEEKLEVPIPDIIIDKNTDTTYKKGRFFGKVKRTPFYHCL